MLVLIHIEVDPDMRVWKAHEISEQVQADLVKYGPNVVDVIVHIEPKGEG